MLKPPRQRLASPVEQPQISVGQVSELADLALGTRSGVKRY